MLQENEKEIHTYIKESRVRYDTLPFEDIALSSSVNGMVKYYDRDHIYKKGTPIYVRAALLYNKYIKDNKLTKTHETIFTGEKIKYCHMLTPNPIRENVFAVPNRLPPEFGLHDYIDRDEQFNKTFLEPIKAVLDVCGWSPQKINKMGSLWE